MLARVTLHVRQSLESGAVVVTPVPYVELAYAAQTASEAIAALRPLVKDRLESLEPVDRLPFSAPPCAQLLRLPVDVRVADDLLEIAVAVVALELPVTRRKALVAFAPAVPGFEVLQSDGDLDALAVKATKQLAGRLRSWSPSAVAAADEPPGSTLQTLEVEIADGASEDVTHFAQTPSNDDSVLSELGVDLTQESPRQLDGREPIVTRVLETLTDGDRSSVLLVGPPDVGKTALIQEIARRLAIDEVPAALSGRRVIRISANELIAGSTYIGQWQERARRLVKDAKQSRAIVAMGDPVGIIDAGRWSQSDNNLSRFLRPYIESGDLTVICEATPEQLAAAQRKEPSFVNAFHRVEIEPPTTTETTVIASAAAARLAESAGIEIEPDAVVAAVALTGRFEPYRSFPGKAVRLLQDAVQERDDRASSIGRAEVDATFARRTGMPLALLSDEVPMRMIDVQSYFEQRILGQPDAVSAAVDAIAVLKAGLNNPHKPLASFFFVGPTGVGKTELARALAEFLFGDRDRVLRLDMGEYAHGDAVQRLIGTAWGQTEGELTRRVREQPFCVLLLDEFEKAHFSVFDALLGVLDAGRLTDASGRWADFRNAIIVMTSNLGARTRSASLGFGASSDAAGGDRRRYVEEAERYFRPEFFNRIDRIVVFHALSAATVRAIATRELGRLLEREGLARRGTRVEVDEAVIDAVSAAGFHPRYGARPLQRQIEEAVIVPLARLLVHRTPSANEFVRIHVRDREVAASLETVTEQRSAVSRRDRRTQSDEASFEKAYRIAAAFEVELRNDAAALLAGEVRETLSELLPTTHERTFWDDPERAAVMLQGIYRLESVLAKLDRLHTRAEGLLEMAKRVREAQDRTRVAEVPNAVEEMRDQLTIVRLELTAAAAGATAGAAIIATAPIGRGAETWAERLLSMYAAWADRTGRDWSALDERTAIRIEGLGTYDLLAGESGLHRHVLPERNEAVARVTVASAEAVVEEATDPGQVVRVYEEANRTGVRDPRTGARASHLAHVLNDGDIDTFLIAWLRRDGHDASPKEPRLVR